MHPVNLTTLEYLLAIQQYGSISKAASHLYVSQPYLSKLLHEVEEAYHITIFTRGARSVTVTEQGHIFLQMAYEMVQNAKLFDRVFSEEDATQTLKISSFPSSYTVGAYIRLLKENPNKRFRVHFHEEAALKVIKDVASRSAEVGFIFLKESRREANEAFFRSRRMVCKKLFETQPHVFVRAGHPLTQKEHLTREDLYEYGLVAFASLHTDDVYTLDDGYYNDVNTPDLLDYDRFSRITYVYDHGTWHSILRQTDGIAIGNQVTSEQLSPFGFHFLPFPFDTNIQDPTLYNNTLYMIHLRDRPLSPLARQYLDCLCRYRHDPEVE